MAPGPGVMVYLHEVRFPRAFHSTGHIHRVSPDVVLRLLGADNPRHHRTNIYTWKRTKRYQNLAFTFCTKMFEGTNIIIILTKLKISVKSYKLNVT